MTSSGQSSNQTVDLSAQGLRQLQLPLEARPVTLILDRNELKRIENLESYHELKQLSIASNRIVSMSGVLQLANLTVLNLPNNDLSSIEGTRNLTKLTWLNLSGNRIRSIENLTRTVNLRHLDLSDNQITALADLSHLKSLRTLLLHGNRLATLRKLPQYFPGSITILSLAENIIEEMTDFNYRPYIVNWCPGLKLLDGTPVSEPESLKAEWLYSQGRARHFVTGQHSELIAYLCQHCPPREAAQESDLLAKVLNKRRIHRQEVSASRASAASSTANDPAADSVRSSSSTLNRTLNFGLEEEARVVSSGGGGGGGYQPLKHSNLRPSTAPEYQPAQKQPPPQPASNRDRVVRLPPRATLGYETHSSDSDTPPSPSVVGPHFVGNRKPVFADPVRNKELHAAAVRIQSAWRGYRARHLNARIRRLRERLYRRRVQQHLAFLHRQLEVYYESYQQERRCRLLQVVEAVRCLLGEVEQLKRWQPAVNASLQRLEERNDLAELQIQRLREELQQQRTDGEEASGSNQNNKDAGATSGAALTTATAVTDLLSSVKHPGCPLPPTQVTVVALDNDNGANVRSIEVRWQPSDGIVTAKGTLTPGGITGYAVYINGTEQARVYDSKCSCTVDLPQTIVSAAAAAGAPPPPIAVAVAAVSDLGESCLSSPLAVFRVGQTATADHRDDGDDDGEEEEAVSSRSSEAYERADVEDVAAAAARMLSLTPAEGSDADVSAGDFDIPPSSAGGETLSLTMLQILLQATLLMTSSSLVAASEGDQAYVHHICMEKCLAKAGCSEAKVRRDRAAHPLTRWTTDSCEDQCKHDCLWQTVTAFHRDGLPTPKFYGRWPFLRLLGLQEPASALFSALNCACHVYMFAAFREQVNPQSPMYNVWHLYSLVAIATWLSSTVFHAKDIPLTEQLDYFSALLYLLTCLFCLACRLTVQRDNDYSKNRSNLIGLAAVAIASIVFYIRHVWYLSCVHFDYGYNMTVNLSVGAANCIGWLIWSIRRVRSQPYTRDCLLTVALLNGLVLLEVLDFPPIWWVLDAHSLWHGGTVLLAVPWYRFAIADSAATAVNVQQRIQQLRRLVQLVEQATPQLTQRRQQRQQQQGSDFGLHLRNLVRVRCSSASCPDEYVSAQEAALRDLLASRAKRDFPCQPLAVDVQPSTQRILQRWTATGVDSAILDPTTNSTTEDEQTEQYLQQLRKPIDIFPNGQFNKLAAPVWRHTSLDTLARDCAACCLDCLRVAAQSFAELEQHQQASSSTDEASASSTSAFISHAMMSIICDRLARSRGVDLLVDVGSGKGYLGACLYLAHGQRVLEIDAKPGNTAGAIKRRDNLEREMAIPAKTRRRQLVRDAQHLADIVAREFYDQSPNCGLLVNVGCCYNLLTEAFCTSPCEQLQRQQEAAQSIEPPAPGFPLSARLQARRFCIGRNARILASQSPERLADSEDQRQMHRSMFYRVLLQQLLLDQLGRTDDNWVVGKIGKRCPDFLAYARLGMKRLGLAELSEQISDECIVEYEHRFAHVERRLFRFFLLRCLLAPAVEACILLDRLLWLMERRQQGKFNAAKIV
uniref:Post-GPI attachment to proteins factor 3 n=1 Tax=Macrostomum lignano TaxID=282301 RepID=A0A1I8HRI4_9PLAT